jgi:hypothetical protein
VSRVLAGLPIPLREAETRVSVTFPAASAADAAIARQAATAKEMIVVLRIRRVIVAGAGAPRGDAVRG